MGLATQLRSLDDQRLKALLIARPDLLERPPATFEQVAARAAAYNSQLVCLTGLNLFLHQLLELVALGGSPTTLERLSDLAGPDVTADELADGFRHLHELGLVAFEAPSVRLVGELGQRLGVPGIGRPVRTLLAGRTVEELRRIVAALSVGLPTPAPRKADLVAAVANLIEDPPSLRDLLADAPAEVVALLDQLHADDARTVISYSSFAQGSRPSTNPVDRAIQWLAQRALLVQTAWGTSELVGEVGLLWRGGVPFPGMSAQPPPLAPVPHGPAVDASAEAGAAAAHLLDLLSRLVHALGTEPAPLLKTGGVGVRVVRRVAGLTELDERDAAALVELAGVAGLVDDRGDELRPSALFEPWSSLEPVDRWLHVLRSWLAARVYVRAAGARDDRDKVVPPLSSMTTGFDAPLQRRAVLEALAAVPAAHAVDRDLLVGNLVWTRPHRWATAPASPDVAIAWFLDEAALLGATAVGSLAPAVRFELDGDRDNARAAAQLGLPEPEAGFIVQADLTVLALGSLDPRVAGPLGKFADVESRGGATVYRLSAASIGRALATGGSTGEILGLLETHSRSGVPQPVRVLVEDVGRRYGRARVGHAASYLRCDDEALLAELVRHRKLARLGLRQLAPTVAVSSVSPDALLHAVTGAGYLPAEEDETGDLVVRRPSAAKAGPAVRLLAGPDAAAPSSVEAAGSAARGGPLRSGRPSGDPAELAARAEALVAQLRGGAAGQKSAPAGRASTGGSGGGAGGRGIRLPGQASLGFGGPFDDGDVDDGAEHSEDPAAYPALLQAARREVRAVSLGVLEDDGDVELIGTPLVVRNGSVAMLCSDCSDVHEVDFDEIGWVELLGPWQHGRGGRRGAGEEAW